MNTHKEKFAEYPCTEINFARIRVTIEHPEAPHSFTSAMHIPDHMINDFVREVEARKYIQAVFDSKRRDEFDLRQAQMALHEAEDRARETRRQLSHLVTRSLSDSFAKEVTS